MSLYRAHLTYAYELTDEGSASPLTPDHLTRYLARPSPESWACRAWCRRGTTTNNGQTLDCRFNGLANVPRHVNEPDATALEVLVDGKAHELLTNDQRNQS